MNDAFNSDQIRGNSRNAISGECPSFRLFYLDLRYSASTMLRMGRTPGSRNAPHKCSSCDEMVLRRVRCRMCQRARLCRSCRKLGIAGYLHKAPDVPFVICRSCVDTDYSLAVTMAAVVWGGPLRILTCELEPGRWVASVSQWIPIREWAASEDEAIAAVKARLAPAIADWPELTEQLQMPWEFETAIAEFQASVRKDAD